MTAVVGLVCPDGIWLGADRCVSDGSGNVIVATTSKLFRIGDCLCGTAGDLRTLNIFHAIDVPHRRARQPVEAYVQNVLEGIRAALHEYGALRVTNEQHSTENELIVATHGRLFITDGSFAAVEPAAPYHAIGSGGEYALGAIHALDERGYTRHKAMVHDALEAASAFRADVSPPYDLEFIAAPAVKQSRPRKSPRRAAKR